MSLPITASSTNMAESRPLLPRRPRRAELAHRGEGITLMSANAPHRHSPHFGVMERKKRRRRRGRRPAGWQ